MISLSHVYKTYSGPTHALRDVDLVIQKGEFVFITGPSGAGKTTLFRMISAFDRPTSGEVQVAGFDLTKMTDRDLPLFRRQVGVIFQDFRLLFDRTIFENVALPVIIRGDRSVQIKRRVDELLDLVGLGFKADYYPEQLSGGEQQRVSIARALIHHPGVLIADEPTGNLDPDLSQEIMGLLDKANAQGTTVFVATHDREIVRQSSKRVVQIQSGHLESSC